MSNLIFKMTQIQLNYTKAADVGLKTNTNHKKPCTYSSTLSKKMPETLEKLGTRYSPNITRDLMGHVKSKKSSPRFERQENKPSHGYRKNIQV